MENEIVRPYVKKDNKKTILLVAAYFVLVIIILVEAVIIVRVHNANTRLGELCSDYETEISDLEKRSENIDQLIEINAMVAEYSSKIEKDYEHAKSVLEILERISGEDTSAALDSLDDAYNTVTDNISVIHDLYDEFGSGYNGVEISIYDETYNGIEGIYDEWRKFYEESIPPIEKLILGE